MKHPALSLLLASAAFTAATGPALADRRAFTFTYEYVTQPEGNLELEYYNTQARSRFGDGGVSSMSQQLEIEYGITDHTDVSLYQVVEQEGAGGLRYAETKLRARHRFAERGELPVDTLLYLELVKAFGTSAYELEPKLILGKDVGQATLALNLIPAIELVAERAPGGDEELELEFEPGFAAGVTYEVSPKVKVGAEVWGKLEHPFDDAELVTSAGPAVSWAPSTKLWVTGTAGVGLTEAADDLVVRFILALGL
ncbi:MAG: hypothetical protein KBG28_18030 [Kofleriaceae bacterium]|nr:hypothetical protein [Kofleriaceae bacterium]MBP6840157.1 hypothetical protein [Kofleriaceae bacterium]MBP9205879.1 hypothetical protein [Kofleriaceae bacterium]